MITAERLTEAAVAAGHLVLDAESLLRLKKRNRSYLQLVSYKKSSIFIIVKII